MTPSECERYREIVQARMRGENDPVPVATWVRTLEDRFPVRAAQIATKAWRDTLRETNTGGRDA